jgi:class 3 adenylate cyclase
LTDFSQIENSLGIVKDHKDKVDKATTFVKRINRKNLGYVAIAHFDLPQSTKKTLRHGQKKIIPEMLFHNAVCRFIVQSYRGKVVKDLGDAVLATFNNAGIACECALNVIYNLRKYGDGVCTKIAISDGIVEKITINNRGDVYGTAVSLCARIASHATPDSILVNDTVYQDVETVLKGNREVRFEKPIYKTLKDFGRKKLYKISLNYSKIKTKWN